MIEINKNVFCLYLTVKDLESISFWSVDMQALPFPFSSPHFAGEACSQLNVLLASPSSSDPFSCVSYP